jgi:methylenetetrahydrofolate reductase (NADPH)
MPAQTLERPDLDDRGLRRRMAELVVNGSIEVVPREAHRAAEIAALLPAGTAAYVPALPGQPLAPMFDALRTLHAAGFDPVPHVAARRMPSREALREFLARAVGECGVHRVLLLGGDLDAPAGPYADAAAVLRDDVLRACGVREAGFAGYPEGHPRIDAARLEAALHEKLGLAREQGLGTSVVTQFAFAPARIAAYCASLARSAPDVPVYVGLAGPANPVTLLRYAQRCGVAASLRALQNLGTQAARLIGHLDPEDLLHGVANYCGARPGCSVVGVHLYGFGGAVPTAQWMRRMIAG